MDAAFSLLQRLAALTTGSEVRPLSGNSRRNKKGRSSIRIGFARCRRVPRDHKQPHDGNQAITGNAGDPAGNGNFGTSSAENNIFPKGASSAEVNLFPNIAESLGGNVARTGATEGFDFFSAEKLVVAAHLRTLPVKKVVTGIKTADLLLKAIKAASGVMILLEAQGGNVSALGSPDGLILGIKAAKVVIKGFKMSQKALKSRGLNNFGFGGRFKSMSNGIKASWGALDALRGSKAIFCEISSGRAAAVNLVLKSYEACRGAVSTVEALGSFKVGFVSAFANAVVGIKGALGGIGVMIKAWVVSKELYVVLIKGLGLSHGARKIFRIIAEGREELTLLSQRLEEESMNRVKFSRFCKVVLSSVVKESPDSDGKRMMSLIFCLSALSNACCYQNPPEVMLFSVQGLETQIYGSSSFSLGGGGVVGA